MNVVRKMADQDDDAHECRRELLLPSDNNGTSTLTRSNNEEYHYAATINPAESNFEYGTSINDAREIMYAGNDMNAYALPNGKEVQSLPQAKMRENREVWDKKLDFLLSVIGYAVDLSNVWRFPYICYKNGGGAYLLPYLIMFLIGGLPLFYLELALGQYQKCGVISVWKRICPIFKGIGFGICIMATYVSWYYNTIMAWALYFVFSTFRSGGVPWASCNNTWNTPYCVTLERIHEGANATNQRSSSEEFYNRAVLEIQRSDGMDNLGGIKWTIMICLIAIFMIVYFSLWKGIKSSGKAVWITATVPYIVLTTLLIRGAMLPGADKGLWYYVTPQWDKLADFQVWNEAASQIFFSLGPGFGVLLALSSYNKTHNNCYYDAMLTGFINIMTNLMSGCVVFASIGYMSHKMKMRIEDVVKDPTTLAFIAYPEIIGTLPGSTFWGILFFVMLITLGLDSTFGGLESLITAICDEWPAIGNHREIFVLFLMLYCFLGALPTTTYGGAYVVQMLDIHAVPFSILFFVVLEAIAICWLYGIRRFTKDVTFMLGFKPGPYWRICWSIINPFFLIAILIGSFYYRPPLEYGPYVYPTWAQVVAWMITASSMSCVPIYAIYAIITTPGTFKERMNKLLQPQEVPCLTDFRETVEETANLGIMIANTTALDGKVPGKTSAPSSP